MDKGDLFLPPDFNYVIISQQGDIMSDGNPTPGIFDGMGAFPGSGCTVLIRNHENRRRAGEIPVVVPGGLRYDDDATYVAGNTKLRIRDNAKSGVYTVLESFAILGGTDTNCAGGEIPWLTWITCEEVVNRGSTGKKHGYAYEIDSRALGPVAALPILSAGRFAHEAVAGEIYDFAKNITNDSEFCGGCFDPDGETLYVSQQGGRPSPPAVTYAIFGPFHKLIP